MAIVIRAVQAETMQKPIAMAFAATVSLAGIQAASAMPVAPQPAGDLVSQVAEGCGPGMMRDRMGRCRGMMRPMRPMMRPMMRPCPRGMHMGPRGGCRPNWR